MARAKKERPAADELAPEERCPAHLVDELAALHYDRATVEMWTGQRARAALAKHRRDTGIASSRADAAAQRIDGVVFPPPMPERLEAASWLGKAIGGTCDWELRLAIEHAVSQLAADELVRLATHLIQRLKTTPELPQTGNLLGKTVPARSGVEKAAEPTDSSVEF